jgi:hypothetical protein
VVVKERAEVAKGRDRKDPREEMTTTMMAQAQKERAEVAKGRDRKDPREEMTTTMMAQALKERAEVAKGRDRKDPREEMTTTTMAQERADRLFRRCRRNVRVVLEMNMMIVTKVKCAALMTAANTDISVFPKRNVSR